MNFVGFFYVIACAVTSIGSMRWELQKAREKLTNEIKTETDANERYDFVFVWQIWWIAVRK